MAHSLNYAQTWSPELIASNVQNLLCSPFLKSNVKWLDAKTFHFTQLSVSGFRNHTRGGAFKEGKVTESDVAYTITHDRDIQFLVDKLDVDETNKTASMKNVAMQFEKTRAIPETDALFFEQCAQSAILHGEEGCATEEDLSLITKDNVIEKLTKAMSPVKRYRGSLIGYVSSAVMDALSLAIADKAKVEWTNISGMEYGISTRAVSFNGVYIFEVLDDDRFCTEFDYNDTIDGGYAKAVSGRKIGILFASTEKVSVVKKIITINYFEAGTHPLGDGYLYQHREAWDTFVFPNGNSKKYDAVSVVYANA